jgi:nucleotide-binding universal stress UspA family protein
VTAEHVLTFGDDGSAGADTAWGWVTAQPWPNWQVEVVAIRALSPDSFSHAASEFELRNWLPENPRLGQSGWQVGEVVHLTVEHDPRLILSSRGGSDLVVIGARGRGLLKSMRLGSTAEWLMQCPNTPLLIAKNSDSVKKILVCVDGSPHAWAGVETLAAMPLVKGAAVTVLGVVESAGEVAKRVVVAGDLLEAAGADVTEIVAEQDPLVMSVSPRMAISDLLRDESPDLVVMGTRGMTGLKKVLVGSVASAITHHAECSVLLARAAD